jgi:hypothetical protein
MGQRDSPTTAGARSTIAPLSLLFVAAESMSGP